MRVGHGSSPNRQISSSSISKQEDAFALAWRPRKTEETICFHVRSKGVTHTQRRSLLPQKVENGWGKQLGVALGPAAEGQEFYSSISKHPEQQQWPAEASTPAQ